MLEAWQLAVYGVLGFIMAILSGIAGAGAGFIMTPLLILFGLTPAQAISSGKFNGIATTIGSLSGLRSYSGKVSRRRIAAIMVLAFLVGLIVPLVIKSFDSRYYQLTLGIILLLMIPIMLYRKVGIRPLQPSPARKTLGGILLTFSLFVQGVFSSGAGSLVNIVLMGMLGMTANEAHITKRWSQLILNITIILGVIGSGLIVWQVVAINVFTGLTGSYIGGRVAIKKGDAFVVNVMIALIFVAAIVMIANAL